MTELQELPAPIVALNSALEKSASFSDDPVKYCTELKFARVDVPELLGATRTPSLRNLDGTEPYMHSGQIATLTDVIDHYNRAPLAMVGHNEAKPLGLSRRERRQLEVFLETLAAPLATDPEWLESPGTNTETSDRPPESAR